jgi:ATP-dependent helicase HrpA
VATERATLYGLPVVTDRTVQYGRIDPVLSRELFIRRALVEGEWRGRHDFLTENRALVEEVEALEHRARRRDILVDDEALFSFYDARVPADVVSAAHFDRWWRDARREDPRALTFTREMLVDAAAAAAMDPRDWPETWTQGDLELRLSYRFEPGAADDGVTVHVPLPVLGQLRADRFEWLVPGLREELVTTLLRSLPKELRRPLVPIPETAEAVLAALRPRRRPLLEDMAEQVERLRGVRVPAEAFDLARLPDHLRVTFMVQDAERGVLAADKSLERVREQVRPRLRDELTAASGRLERHGERSWVFGTLPQSVTLPGTGAAVTAYPALVDEGDAVGVRVLETVAAQRSAMAAGTRRLLLLTVPSPAKLVYDRLGNAARLAVTPGVLDDCVTAAVDALVAEGGGPAWDEAGFARLRDVVAGSLADRTAAIVAGVAGVLDAAREVETRLDELTAVPLQPARADVREQLRRLVYPGFVSAAGAARLPDIERYLQAAARRLERLPNAVAVDRDRMSSIHELERAYRERLRAAPSPALVRDVPWMLEELRVHHFAQNLARGGVSAKRIRRALTEGAPGA